MEQQSRHRAETLVRTIGHVTPGILRGLVRHRARASIISEEAVWIGVIATVGLTIVAAFMTGLGGVLQKALATISGQV